MIKHYRWRPDTCACEINETYDTGTDTWDAEETYINPDGKVFNTYRCLAHEEITDAKELYGVLHKNPDGENRIKNELEAEFLKDNNIAQDVVGQDGNTIRQYKNGVEFNWSFSGTGRNRLLNVGIKGAIVPKSRKDSIKTFSDSKYGSTRVQIN